MARPVVYFARAVDGFDRAGALAEGQAVAVALRRYGLELLDPVATWIEAETPAATSAGYAGSARHTGSNGRTRSTSDNQVTADSRVAADPAAMVESDLRNLRRADGLLVDMSAAGRTYVGCVCELTYAYLWQIPAVVWVGETGLEQRSWLRYHARTVVRDRDEALATMASLLSS